MPRECLRPPLSARRRPVVGGRGPTPPTTPRESLANPATPQPSHIYGHRRALPRGYPPAATGARALAACCRRSTSASRSAT